MILGGPGCRLQTCSCLAAEWFNSTFRASLDRLRIFYSHELILKYTEIQSIMPLHKFPPKMWDALKLKQGIYARLPEHYLKSLQSKEPTPVHWRPLGVEYRANPKTGQKERVQDTPIPIYYPPQSQDGLWGGEGWICGYRYANNDKLSTRLRKTWKPQLLKRELYSEILDHKFTITVTGRTLDLIDAAYGFDFYILKTPKEDLNSKLGMDLKRAMLLRLARKNTELYPADPVKREKIYNKYKQFEIIEEEVEWVGLSLEEALEKQRQLEHKEPEPLFKVFVDKLVEELHIQKLSEPHLIEKK